MDQQGYRQFLQTRKFSDNQIEQHIAIVERFEAFLKSCQPPTTLEQASSEAAQAFVEVLIVEGQNSFDNLVSLARYGNFSKNHAVSVAILELLDGSEALEGMHRKVGQVVGEQKRDAICKEKNHA